MGLISAAAAVAALLDKLLALARAALGMLPVSGNAVRASGIAAVAVAAAIVLGLGAWALWPESRHDGAAARGSQCREACDKAHLEAENAALRLAAAHGARQRASQAKAIEDLEATNDDLRKTNEVIRAKSPHPDSLAFPADDPWLRERGSRRAAAGAADGARRRRDGAVAMP